MTATRRKKKRTHVRPTTESTPHIPRSFVFARGEVAPSLRSLSLEIRRVFEPHTATRLKVRRSNAMRDFISMAGPLGVSHMVVLSSTNLSKYIRFFKLPHGPTLTFELESFSLVSEVLGMQRRPKTPSDALFRQAPLVVMNNFSSPDRSVQLMSSMFQNMFPTITIQQMKVSDCKRVVLLSYDSETNVVEFRHYAVDMKPLSLSRSVRKLVQRRLPNLGRANDVADFVLKGGDVTSDSEFEDTPDGHIQLPGDFDSLNLAERQSAVRLRELGPRFSMKLWKIEDGISSGEVLYHAVVSKTPEEIADSTSRRQQREQTRQQRRALQEKNVQRKKDKTEKERLKRQKRLAGKSDADASDDEEAGAEDGYRAVDDDSNFDEHYDNGSFDDDEEDVERPEQKRRKVKPSPQQSFRSTSSGTRKRSKMPSRRGRS